MNKTAAIYARVSTADQSAAMQIREILEYCSKRQWLSIEQFVDVKSGGSSDREALCRMMGLARKRKIGAVIVYRLDRLARSLKQLIDLLEEFRMLGIEFVSLHEQIDTSTPAGRLQFSILGAFAEFERAIIQERVCSGIAAARAKGRQIGRPKRIADRERIHEMHESGRSWREIEFAMKIPVRTLRRMAEGVAKTP